MWCTTRLYFRTIILFIVHKPDSFSVTDLEDAVNSDLENLRKWLIANKLSLNVAKTEFMLIGSKQMVKNISNFQPNVVIENKRIKQVHECKTLGVTVDQHLSWKSNTDIICGKITSGISALRRLKDFVDRQTLLSIIMLLSAHISITAVKYGMCSVKHNLNDFKNSKIEPLELS